jgi:hypothetical protein
MLQRKGDNYRGVLGIRFRGAADFRTVDKNLGYAAIRKPPDAAGKVLVAALETVKPMVAAIRQALPSDGHDDTP